MVWTSIWDITEKRSEALPHKNNCPNPEKQRKDLLNCNVSCNVFISFAGFKGSFLPFQWYKGRPSTPMCALYRRFTTVPAPAALFWGSACREHQSLNPMENWSRKIMLQKLSVSPKESMNMFSYKSQKKKKKKYCLSSFYLLFYLMFSKSRI